MKLLCILAGLLIFNTPMLRAEETPQQEDTSQGWSPATQSRWMEAQMKYAKALKEHGQGSPEATEAEVMMNTLGRQLGIKPPKTAPETATIEPAAIAAPDISDLSLSEATTSPVPAPMPDIPPEPERKN